MESLFKDCFCSCFYSASYFEFSRTPSAINCDNLRPFINYKVLKDTRNKNIHLKLDIYKFINRK